jgi:hypothetical protein
MEITLTEDWAVPNYLVQSLWESYNWLTPGSDSCENDTSLYRSSRSFVIFSPTSMRASVWT